MSVPQQHSGLTATASEGLLRLLFGLFLAAVAIVLIFKNPVWFASATVLAGILAAREWHRLVRGRGATMDSYAIHAQTVVTAAAIAVAVTSLLLHQKLAAFGFLAAGTAIAWLLGRLQRDNPLWHATGVLYIGIPCLSLVALQALSPHSSTVVLGLFLIVWGTDTGALVFGRLIGGAKLAPAISPGKTWAGTIGGSLTAAAIYALYIAVLSFNALLAFFFALAFSIVAHGGDLFESYVKRRFGTKDSGGLIPGHGGALDRLDSTFAAAPLMALLVFGLNFNPLFGGHW